MTSMISLTDNQKKKNDDRKKLYPDLFKGPIIIPSESDGMNEEAVSELKRILGSPAKGLCFYIVVKNGDNIEIHFRESQPCYGELRKYKETHLDYTDPQPSDSYHPNDLYWPFPDGTPIGLGVKVNTPCNDEDSCAFSFGGVEYKYPEKFTEDYLSFLFSRESPWARGMPNSGCSFVRSESGGNISGAILHDLELDPTVLVNCLNSPVRKVNNALTMSSFKDFYDLGASFKEISVLSSLMNITKYLNMSTKEFIFPGGYPENQGYYDAVLPDVKRMLDCNPRDLTGGTLKNRYDYNRVRLHEIFETQFEDELDKDEDAWEERDTLVDKFMPDSLFNDDGSMKEIRLDPADILKEFRRIYRSNQ